MQKKNFPLLSIRKTVFLLFLLLLATAGCSRKVGCSYLANVHFLGSVEDLNIFARKMADDIINQAQPMLIQRNPNLPIFITTFVDDNNLEQTNAFGRILQKSVCDRFIQHEYPVRETMMGNTIFIEPRQGETVLTRDLSRLALEQHCQAVIVGTWSRVGRTLYISIRAVNPLNNFIISAQSYRLCMDDDILELFHLRTKKKRVEDEIPEPSQPRLNSILFSLTSSL